MFQESLPQGNRIGSALVRGWSSEHWPTVLPAGGRGHPKQSVLSPRIVVSVYIKQSSLSI